MKHRTYIPYLLLTCVLFGCGEQDDSEDPDTIQLAFIPKTSNNLVFGIGNDGAQFGARYLAHETGRGIEVEYLAPSELDPAAERALIRESIDAKKDGLMVSCIDDSITEA